MGNIKYIKQHSTLEIFYPIVKSEGIVDAWTIMNEDIYNLFYPRVESISIAKDSISVTPFSSTTIKYTIIPKDAYNQKVSWSVDDTSIASVSDGAVSGKFPGTTIVSVKSASGGHTDTVEIISQCGNTDLLYAGSVNLTDRLADVSSILPVYSKQFGAARLYDHIYSIPADFARECDIKALQLPSTITEIGDCAFLYNKIANINIPAQVSLLGTDVFAGNDPISIVVEAENTVYDSRNNCNALILTDNNTLLLGSVNTVIPEDVTSIAAYSFERSSIANIDIPASIVNIDNSAFTDCSELESINVSADNEVYSSIEGVLYNKDQSILLNVPHKVKSLVIPHTCTISEIDVLNTNFPYVESFNSGGLVGELSATPFQGHSNIKTVVLGPGVTKLNMEAFRMSSLENITMSEGLQIIDPRPFDYCGQLKSITIPSSVVDANVSDYGFGGGLNSLESFVVAEGNSIYDSRDNCNAFIETDTNTLLVGFPISTIPDSIVTIGYGAFEGNGCDSHIVIPESVTSIRPYAFYRCSTLEDIVLPTNLLQIAEYTFGRCQSLKSIDIPEGVTIIDRRAFYNCSSLESVIIPNNVTLMGSYAFYGCTSLNAVTIGNSITDIGDHTFYNCSSLTSVTIPEGVTVIDTYAFSYCGSLVSVTLPASIATIANKAFYNSGNLSEMNYAGTMENWANVSCGSDWISGTNITSINCSDGVINL